MFILLIAVHILVAVALVLVVLLQVGKGQSIGAAFGGASSSQTIFGSRGPTTFLSRMTTVAAALFMVTSLSLAYFSAHRGQSSVITNQSPAAVDQPALPGPPAAPEDARPVESRTGDRGPRGNDPVGLTKAARQLGARTMPLTRIVSRRYAVRPVPLGHRFPGTTICRSGGNGRHAILRGWCLTRRGGSNPPFGIPVQSRPRVPWSEYSALS